MSGSTKLPVAVVGKQQEWLKEIVEAAATRVVDPERAEALVWAFGEPEDLARVLERGPAISWVQLPAAGVDGYVELFSDGRLWTSAKGAFADAVAEHTLALILAGLRLLVKRARAHRWEEKGGRSLFERRVTLVGGGGTGSALVRLLEPFRVHVTVVDPQPPSVPGAEQTVPPAQLHEALRDTDVVVLAPALTPETRGMIGREELRTMGSRCLLVNVGRGPLVKTDDLVEALREGWIAGAGLDVTDPEPLPPDHPLWDLDNCLITPHTANPSETEREGLRRRITANIEARLAGRPLEGVIDPKLGY